MADTLDAAGARDMLVAVSQSMIDQTDVLTDADLAIGDGDHGIGMRRGFEAALEALRAGEPESVDAAFKAIGMAILSNTGGAAGAVFGTLVPLRRQGICRRGVVDGESFAAFLEEGLAAVLKRGGVTEGQKTMVDALAPAARAAACCRRRGWPQAGDRRGGIGRARRRRGDERHDRHHRQGALARRTQHRPSRSRRDLDLADPQGNAGFHREGLTVSGTST